VLWFRVHSRGRSDVCGVSEAHSAVLLRPFVDLERQMSKVKKITNMPKSFLAITPPQMVQFTWSTDQNHIGPSNFQFRGALPCCATHCRFTYTPHVFNAVLRAILSNFSTTFRNRRKLERQSYSVAKISLWYVHLFWCGTWGIQTDGGTELP